MLPQAWRRMHAAKRMHWQYLSSYKRKFSMQDKASFRQALIGTFSSEFFASIHAEKGKHLADTSEDPAVPVFIVGLPRSGKKMRYIINTRSQKVKSKL
jgi:hypothetical protein